MGMIKYMQSLGKQDYDAVKRIAKARGASVSEVVRQAIDEWLELRKPVEEKQ